MKRFNKRFVILTVALAFLTSAFSPFMPLRVSASTAAMTMPGSSAVAVPGSASGSTHQTPLANVLNADGTLNAGAEARGSYDVSGYRMETTATGAPRFVQTSCGPPNTGSWSTEFNLIAGANNYVLAMLVSGNDIYVGGSFTQASNVAANRVARFNTLTRTWSALGSGGGNGVDKDVLALALVGNDLYVGGYFTQANVGGAAITANHIARFNTLTNQWSAVGSDGNGVSQPGTSYVYTLAAMGSDLYVGGSFTQANLGGTVIAANNIARFNTTTNQWSKLGTGNGNGVGGEVYALAVIGNDLYIGGNFIQINIGGPLFNATYIVRFSPQTNQWSVVGPGMVIGVNGQVHELVVSGSDLYVGGAFTTVPGAAAYGVARYNTQTNQWSKLGTGPYLNDGVDGSVYALAVIGNDVYVGGQFTSASVNNMPTITNHVARFNPATTTWSELGNGGNGVNNTVYAMAAVGNELFVGGSFTQANVGPSGLAVSNLAAFNLQTNVWNAVGTAVGNGLNGTVGTMLISGSDLYVGGQFTSINASGTMTLAHNVARFNLKTNAWSKLGMDGDGVDGPVYALAVMGDDLYVGGSFTQANVGGINVPAKNLARFNLLTQAWSKLGTDGNGVSQTGNSFANALAVMGSDLYIGGFFTQANAGGTVVPANNIVRFNTLTNTWGILGFGSGNGVNGGVSTIVVSGNALYVGGLFTEAKYNVVTVPANNIARFDTQSSEWRALGFLGSGVDNQVAAIVVSGSDLYVGGSFRQTNLGNAPVAANFIARYNTQTNMWSKLGSGAGNGLDNIVFALAVSGNNLYVGGQLSEANSGGTTVAAKNVAKFDTLTETWSNLGTGSGNGLDSSAFALAASGSDLYAGGQFRKANVGGAGGDTPSPFIAKFSAAPPTVTQVTSSLNPSADTQNVTFTATVTASGTPVNDGCVTFKEGNATLAANIPVNASGQAAFTTASPFSMGNHTVTAFYSGAAEFNSSSGSIVQVVVHNQPPVAKCKNVTVPAGANCTAQASIDNGSFDPDNDPITLTQSPAGPYSKGTTTVTLTVKDNRGAMSQCASTVTVIDNTPPQISCPANVTKVAPATCPVATSVVVTYPTPVATDNCPGVAVACTPPSGTAFPLGTTTVTCTATDTSNNKASCSFTVAAFALALQDDGNPASAVLFNPATGDYRFCCNGVVLAEGKGTPGAHACYVAITHNVADRRVLIQADLNVRRGTASLQVPVGQLQCLVSDFNMADDNCNCP